MSAEAMGRVAMPMPPREVLSRLRRGIEKESLRVRPDGMLATTPHPARLGSALTHPFVTTDFSESQAELITGVHTSAQSCLDELTEIHQVVYRAIDLGVTFFDTADAYGLGSSESQLGEVLGPRRKDVIIASKFGMAMDKEAKLSGASRRYIMSAVEASLTRLKTDWIDFYQLHVPEPKTPIEETMRALDDLVTQGKVRYIGCSNLPAWQVVEANCTASARSFHAFVACQEEYSLLVRNLEHEQLHVIEEHGMSELPYFPLASGLLSGKYKKGQSAPKGTR